MAPSDLDVWAEPIISVPPLPPDRLPQLAEWSLEAFGANDSLFSSSCNGAASGTLTQTLLECCRRERSQNAEEQGPRKMQGSSRGMRMAAATPLGVWPCYSPVADRASPTTRNCRSASPYYVRPRVRSRPGSKGDRLRAKSRQLEEQPLEVPHQPRRQVLARLRQLLEQPRIIIDGNALEREESGRRHPTSSKAQTPTPHSSWLNVDMTTSMCMSTHGGQAILRDLEGAEGRYKGDICRSTISGRLSELLQVQGSIRKRMSRKPEHEIIEISRPSISQTRLVTPTQTVHQEALIEDHGSTRDVLTPSSTRRFARISRIKLKTKKKGLYRKSSGSVVDLALAASRERIIAEGSRILKDLIDKHATIVSGIFRCYDIDESGVLELAELRAVLEDVGLVPQTPAEKEAIRHCLLRLFRAGSTSDSDEDTPIDWNNSPKVTAPAGGAKFQDVFSRKCQVGRQDLARFIRSARKCMQDVRSKKYFETFRRFDVLEQGELDFDTMLNIFKDLDLLGFPAQHEETKAFFVQWLLRTMDSSIIPPEPNRNDDDTPPEWTFGSEELRLLLLGRKLAAAGPWAISATDILSWSTWKLEGRLFIIGEFEVFVDFLQIAKDFGTNNRHELLAKSLGIKDVRLFMEFRHVLDDLYAEFQQLDSESTGFIDETQVWLFLNQLGIAPMSAEEKAILYSITSFKIWSRRPAINSSPLDDAQAPITQNAEPLGTGIRFLMRNGTHRLPSDFWKKSPTRLVVDFPGFLEILSRLQAWLQKAMQEDLRSLFYRGLRRRADGQATAEVLGIKEVSLALADLDMSPRNTEDQRQLCKFLEETNEWGFEPMTMDFDTFVRLIWRVREWRARMERAEDLKVAEEKGFSVRAAQEYRTAYDALAPEWQGELSIAGVRTIFKVIGLNITSELLRSLFDNVGRQSEGVTFRQFLSMIQLLEERRAKVFEMTSNFGTSSGGGRRETQFMRQHIQAPLIQQAVRCASPCSPLSPQLNARTPPPFGCTRRQD